MLERLPWGYVRGQLDACAGCADVLTWFAAGAAATGKGDEWAHNDNGSDGCDGSGDNGPDRRHLRTAWHDLRPLWLKERHPAVDARTAGDVDAVVHGNGGAAAPSTEAALRVLRADFGFS